MWCPFRKGECDKNCRAWVDDPGICMIAGALECYAFITGMTLENLSEGEQVGKAVEEKKEIEAEVIKKCFLCPDEDCKKEECVCCLCGLHFIQHSRTR